MDKLGLFHPLFERADEIAAKGRELRREDQRVIIGALKAMGALP